MQHPIRVITVEREFGSHGAQFAHDLADRLGWKLLDSELVSGAARAAGVPAEKAAQIENQPDPWYYRYGKVFWQDSMWYSNGPCDDQVFDCERMYALIRKQIVDAAKEGNCVIVGRGGMCALAGQPGCFHIFVYATMAAKKEWFIQGFPDQADRAEQELIAVDKRRAAVIKRVYNQEWCSRGLYHMLLNAAMGTDAMIASAAGAAGLRVPEPAHSS
ncbi:MAG TPA: cytidylate kinase-like family protein [Terracidiphilus sp.]|nr:cytidylate kinase-like family protein [Terracidiphilus sp.]